MYRIICYTLFDITNTGVLNRNRPSEGIDPVVWLRQRNTQCNFDTILQAINLRSQPEIIKYPQQSIITLSNFKDFGYLFSEIEEEINSWNFEFEIHHASVFDNGITELGGLYEDCDKIPMLKVGTEWEKLPDYLDSSDELKNIYFKVVT